MENKREKLGSRLGFIFLSAGCAIGLGNVWRFPFITGQYGGAAFVLVYILFLIVLGLQIMTMEFSVGRASGQSSINSFKRLEPEGTKWHLNGIMGFLGNIVLMMFYTTVTGWMLAYFWYSLSGKLCVLTPDEIGQTFGALLSNPASLIFWMLLSVAAGTLICFSGLQKGVENVTKIMMIALLVLVLSLALRSVTLDGASKGLEFYMKPDFGKLVEHGLWTSIYAALGQAFFTLSLGIGALAIFGSYIGKERTLMGEAACVIALDTFVALMSGFIIFPSCFAYGVDAGAGPGLIFVSLPVMFNHMTGGRFWGTLFFLLMSFAAMSTVIAVFETILANAIDTRGWSRQRAAFTTGLLIAVLSVPCCLGFNLWADFQPLGKGTCVLDLEDFIVSNNLLPIGSLFYLFFCTRKNGWGWDNFIKEVNTGRGIKFPVCVRWYVTYIIPVIMTVVIVWGYIDKFMK
ncbi:MAG: sodium-dependent transporter [Synergistaceae bacterium]|nr:sodium-dependent transporter [Candidatus Equadaptatus faecalis]